MALLGRKSTVSLLSTIGFYSIIVSLLYSVQKKLIFLPDNLDKDHTYQFDIPFQEFNLTHENGEDVNSLYFPAEESKALILYFHGNSKNLQHWGKYLPDLVNRGYNVVAIDYRGYGKSDGSVSEKGMYEDADLLYDWAKKNHPEKEIILWGRSLGSGVASQLSTHKQAKTLILETPFYNMTELVKTRFPLLVVPVEMKYKFPNNEHIQNNEMTTLIIQGTKDSIVPLKSAVKLKKILETEDHFFTIKGAGHRNLHEFNDYQAVLDEIL